jgi:hypothetical protein
MASPVAAKKKFQKREELSKMSVGELQMFLAERGKSCKGCSEKDHYVDEAFKFRKKRVQVEHLELKMEGQGQEGNAKSKKGFEFSREQFMEQVLRTMA